MNFFILFLLILACLVNESVLFVMGSSPSLVKCTVPFVTYKVNSPADGIACVLINGADKPTLMVYAEGRMNNGNYRLLSYGNKLGDVTYSGLAMSPANPGDLNCKGILYVDFKFKGPSKSPSNVLIISNSKSASNSLNLTKSVDGVNFNKLPLLTTCGSNYKTYLAPTSDREKGFRCVLADTSSNARVYVGPGIYDNKAYVLMGLGKSSAGFGAADRGFPGENGAWHDYGFNPEIKVSSNGSLTGVPWTIAPSNFTFNWGNAVGSV